MKKSTILLSAIALGAIIAISSCAKKGCTDSKATNYDAGAKTDDGSCQYPIDKFVGSYKVRDTITSGGSFVKVELYTVICEKDLNNKNQVVFKNFNYTSTNDITATLAGSNTLILKEDYIGLSGEAELSGDTLYFRYKEYFDHRGFGIKQP